MILNNRKFRESKLINNKFINNLRYTLSNIWNNTKLNINKIFLFEMIYKIIVAIVFIPMISFVIQVAIMGMGFFNLTNNELANLAFKVPGIIAVILILIVSFIVIFTEIAVLTDIANKSYHREKVSIAESVTDVLRILPKNIGIHIIPLLFLCITMGPIGGVGLSSSLIKNLSIPLFVKVELFRTLNGQIFLIGVVLISLLIALKWILVIPVIIVEKTSLKVSLKKSKELYKENRSKVFAFLLLWIMLNAIVKLIPLFLYQEIGGLFVSNRLEMNIFLTIFIVIHALVSLVTLPVFITFLIELYYRCVGKKINEKTNNKEYKIKSNKTYLYIKENKKKFTALVTLSFIIMVFYTSYSVVYRQSGNKEVLVTAHRGNIIDSPENSMSSIESAVYTEADFAEIDVMTTKDNKVVLFHDTTLTRFDGTNRKIKDMTLEEVKTVDIGSSFDPGFSEERIPTLEEVFKEYKGKIKFNIELKSQYKDDPLSKEVARVIKEYNMEDEVVVSSLNYNSITKFKEEGLDVKVGYIFSLGVGDFSKIDVDFISVEYGMLTKELIDTMHGLGKEVHVWTLNNDEEIANAGLLGVDNIITDDVWSTRATLMTAGLKPQIGHSDNEEETIFESEEEVLISQDMSEEIAKHTEINYEWLFYYNIEYILKYVNI